MTRMNGLGMDAGWLYAGLGAAVAAVIVAMAGLVLCRLLQGRPAPLRYGLLLAALCATGLAPVAAIASRTVGWAAVQVPALVIDRPIIVTTGPVSVPRPGIGVPALPAAVESLASAAEPVRAASVRLPTWREAGAALIWAWILGAAVAMGRLVRDVVRLRRLRRSLEPCRDAGAAALLARAARAVGLRRPPRLCESAAVPVPVVVGPFDPVVVLPAGMAAGLDRDQLSAVLVHEAAHVVHGDLVVGILEHAVGAAFWWCPPVHSLNRRLADLREQICDDYVVVAHGNGLRLAEVLLELAGRWRAARRPLALGMMGAIDERPGIEGRVERLIEGTARNASMTRMNRAALAATVAFAAFAVAVVAATTIRAADEAPAAAAPPAEMAADELQALDAALAWIATQQRADGSWVLDGKPVPKPDRAAATSLAILAFLGRGHDHKAPGPYREQLAAGVNALVAFVGEDGGVQTIAPAQMYTQGLMAMALCRAYGRTKDPALQKPAQATLDFLVQAQDPRGGGWRYLPKQPGDTSVLGFVAEALANGKAAGLGVMPETWQGVSRFLDAVQGDPAGRTYGYVGPGTSPTLKPIGLLGRLRTGWKRDHPVMAEEVTLIAVAGPKTDDLYFDYHATRLMHEAADAETWAAWRAAIRTILLKRQVTDPKAGKEQGSFVAGKWGGPLLQTSLAALILAEPLQPPAIRPRGPDGEGGK